MTPRRGWTRARRSVTTISGCMLFVASLVLGSTIVAHGEARPIVRALVIISFCLALLGIYVAAAGFWGGWSPASTVGRIRSARVALAWAILAGASMCFGLPLLSRGTMSAAEWMSVAILSALLAIALFSFVFVGSRTGAVVTTLGIAAVYSFFTALKFLLLLSTPTFDGPAAILSLLLAGSFSVALVCAFALIWPLRRSQPSALVRTE